MALHISEGQPHCANTARLRKRALSKLRAKSQGDLDSAIESAGHYAQKMNTTMFIYHGNSYGAGVWRVFYKRGEYLNTANNTGDVVYSVTPDLTISVHLIERESCAF